MFKKCYSLLTCSRKKLSIDDRISFNPEHASYFVEDGNYKMRIGGEMLGYVYTESIVFKCYSIRISFCTKTIPFFILASQNTLITDIAIVLNSKHDEECLLDICYLDMLKIQSVSDWFSYELEEQIY